MEELYCDEIIEYIDDETRLKINLEFENSESDNDEIKMIDLIIFPKKMQSRKESNIYTNLIQYINDNYYESILEKGNISHFVPYDEPKYYFDLEKNIIEITYIHDVRKYNVLVNYSLNIVEDSLYDNYLMDTPFQEY